MKKLLGLVVSCRMQKTVIVEVKTQVKHALYGKRIMKKKRYAVHDPEKKSFFRRAHLDSYMQTYK